MKKSFKAVELKYLDAETVMKIREWRNRDFVRKMSRQQDIISEQTHMQYINRLREDQNRGLFVFYLDNEPFAVYQYILNQDKGYVESSHYLVDEKYQQLGYGAILSFFELDIIFYILNYSKSYGEVLECNKKTIALHRKFGATLEKIMPKVKQPNGERYDVYCFSIHRDTWENNKQKYQKVIDILIDDYSVKEDIVF